MNNNNIAPSTSWTRRAARAAATYLLIAGVTLALADLALIATGLFPPVVQAGHPELGWVPAWPSGSATTERCVEYASGRTYQIARNEDAMRTVYSADALAADTGRLTVAVGGDSQTELCASNDSTHFGFLERDLSGRGFRSAVYAYGAGRYSPLQAYLALRPSLSEYNADVLVLNLYLGNDVYDMLRIDDRPHFSKSDTGYVVSPPIWYEKDPPGTVRRSRVLSLFRSVAQATGLRTIVTRLRYLTAAAAEHGGSIGDVLSYMRSLRRSTATDLGYPAAYSAQMLNQQLFFHHFPGSREEAMSRVRVLLDLIRREQPNAMLVLSPLPSYQGVFRERVDSSFLSVLAGLPITNDEGYLGEERLLADLRSAAESAGWLFVDNLAPLRAYQGADRLFNTHDFHFLPAASELIARAQASVIAEALLARGPDAR